MQNTMTTVDTEGDCARLVTEALELAANGIENRLVEIQAELDDIGPTFGMQWRRTELNREKDELLDQLLGVRCPLRSTVR